LNLVLQTTPGDTQARIDRGYVEFKLNDLDHSIGDASRTLDYAPGNLDAFNNRALAYLTTGEFDQAISDYTMILHLLVATGTSISDPTTAHRQGLAYCGLGKAFGLKGDDINARAAFNLALQIAPDLAIVYRFRGDYEASIGKDAQALSDYARAIELNPQSGEALAGRSWILATTLKVELQDFTTAVSDATKACDLTQWKNPDFLSVLAAAYAASGDFTGATKNQTAAIDILNLESDSGDLAEAARRLTLYQDMKPYSP
jgi:Tfp pilus assembly protein PilF